jgi:hypothetical protein
MRFEEAPLQLQRKKEYDLKGHGFTRAVSS